MTYFEETISSKSDEDLYDILFIHSQDYTRDTIEAAGEEFRRRNLDAPAHSDVVADIKKVRETEEAHLSQTDKALAFVFSTVFVGVPALLAHRHFIEKGEKTKAREWAKWALFGFLFYCVLGVLIRVLTSMVD
jgi:hypothetical protein